MSGAGFWNWDRATDEVWASKDARSILGLHANAPLSRDALLAAIHPSDRAGVVRAISASACHCDTGDLEVRLVPQNNEIRWITARIRPYRDANGMLLRVIGYVIDISQRKQAEANSLKQQQQITHLARIAMLGELSGALAHELQQPLTSILCNAEAAQLLAAKAQFNPEELREILKDIVIEDKRAGQIIQRLRSLLMRGEVHVQRLEIGDVLRDVLALARCTLTERAIQVHSRIGDGVSAVLGDRVELQQVFLNLILNACEAMSANAAGDRSIDIVVALDAEDCAVRTSVIDCGKGIDRDQLEHIFDPFFTTKKSGLGLGLGVCHSIIGAHKGRLWATNNSERGAAFHFTLPAAIG
jgi:C4-dicarboxylate-specific signal transduction histidine kinase